ncbi:MAG: arylesterase [Acidobacteria bacterium]|nr:arylesterase [Acidobacteriota bacterium]
MKSLYRSGISALFILIALVFAGCDASSARRQSNSNPKRPLVTPQIKSDRPKIIAFGDSLTAGFGLLEKESYPYLLQEKLKADGFDYEVVNAGLAGDTSIGGLERVDWVLEQENVKILILELGANDLLRRMPVDKMKQNLETIIKKAQAKKIRVVLCGMLAPPNVGLKYQQDFQSVFPNLATQYKTDFVPFLLDNVALKKELNQADGIHPNAEGEKIMTDNVYKVLKPILSN